MAREKRAGTERKKGETPENVLLVIPGVLPNLNDYITAERIHRQKAAALKRQAEHTIILAAKRQLRGVKFTDPVVMAYTWVEPNRKRDKDNISSFGRKCIQDALVKIGVLQNDGWRNIDSFSDRFFVDTKTPRVEVEIRKASRKRNEKENDAGKGTPGSGCVGGTQGGNGIR